MAVSSTINVDKISEHHKKHKATYMINLFGSIIPIILFIGLVYGKVATLATTDDVHQMLNVHANTEMHPLAKTAVGNVQYQLNTILAIQIEERIEKQLKIVCLNNDLRDALEPTIKQLIRSYDNVSATKYQRPACEQLGVKQ